MKNFIWNIIVGLSLMLIALGCEHEDKNVIVKTNTIINWNLDTITWRLDSISKCKQIMYDVSKESSNDSVDCIIYSYDQETRNLVIKHMNKRLNCCPDSMQSSVKIGNETIFIFESDGGGNCGCICFYDFYFQINGIKEQKYRFIMTQPYLWGKTLNFELDFSKQKSGVECFGKK